MEIYPQEVTVVTFLERLPTKTRQLIELRAGAFAATLEKAIAFLDTGIPPATWYSLLKISASPPTESVEKDGTNGSFLRPTVQQNERGHDDLPMHDGKRAGELLENKKSTCCLPAHAARTSPTW